MLRSRERFARPTVLITALGVVGTTLAGIATTSEPAGAAPSKRPPVQHERVLPHWGATTRHLARPTRRVGPARTHETLPVSASAHLSVSRAADARRSATAASSTLPIKIASLATGTSRPRAIRTGTYVKIEGAAAAKRVGIGGPLLQISRTTDSPDDLAVSLDYSRFANYGGAEYGSRLHFVQLPACALTTPQRAACRAQTPIASTNDARTRIVKTRLTIAPASAVAGQTTTFAHLGSSTRSAAVVAAVAGASGPNGAYTATSLAPSGSWTGGGSSGDFDWSYPIELPPPPGGNDVQPDVDLSYSSGSVDGRVVTTNTQSTALGQGWDYSPGYIERTYRSCSDNTDLATADQTGDRCWAGQILTYSLNGASNTIVYDDTDHDYHLQSDDGSRVELINAGTGAYSNEYWKVTAPNGVQYFFGRNTLPGATTGVTTGATWTVPVCGDVDTACTGDGKGVISPIQTQAWRWNLDYVLDPHNNATAYYYKAETNYYGQDNKNTAVSYVRGGYLDHIDYGMRATATTLSAASDRVAFTVDERCVSTCTTFDSAHAANWPDTPQDQNCASGSSCNNHSPTFWTRKRYVAISTEYWTGTGSTYYIVDQYKLSQSFPKTGDPELELDGITRTGYPASTTFTIPNTGVPTPTASAAGTQLPAVTFTYVLMDNRVAGFNDQPSMWMWRMNTVSTETGENLTIHYDQTGRAPAQCTKTTVPAESDVSTNTAECFPVYWTPLNYPEPQIDWFHKHVVTEVLAQDRNATGPDRDTTYTYVGTPAWHYDDNETVRAKYRTYGQFRGYSQVETRVGNSNHASNGVADADTLTSSIYYRGMDGNPLPNNKTRSASVTDSRGTKVKDSAQYAGMVRETQTFNGDGGDEVSATINAPTTVAVTATRGRVGIIADLVARMVRPGTATAYTDLASGGTRQLTTSNDYDSFGRVQHRTRSGTGIDPQCTTTNYADNAGAPWLRSYVSEVRVSAQSCPSGSTAPTSVLSDAQTYYDGSKTLGTIAGPGDATETQVATTASHMATTDTAYDALGRQTSEIVRLAAGDRKTATAYTPATGPITSVTVTNAANQTTTSTIDPSRGSITEQADVAGHLTDATYDALGRLTAVWKPGQVKGTDSATVTYSYVYSPTAPLATTTNTLVDPGHGKAVSYLTSIAIYDAFGQLRQTQTAAVGGGRTITDSLTDGHGWVTAANGHWKTSGNPTPALPLPTTAQSGIDQSTRTVYDGAGRPLTSTEYMGNTARWTTRTIYSGDSITVVPPNGTTETTTRTDAAGRTSELDQWTTAPTIKNNVVSGGSARVTTYDYDASDRQTTIVTPANDLAHAATWTNHYDLAGRITQADDPDTGTTISTFDDAGEVTKTVDANGAAVSYTYDGLGRKTASYNGADSSAPKLAAWTYDTVQAGQLSSSTSYTATGNYTQKVTAYDTAGNPTGSEFDMSTPDTGFAASYATSELWTTTHLPAITTVAAAGGLPMERIHQNYDAFGDALSTTGYNAYVSDATFSPYGEPTQYTLGVNNQTGWLTYTRDPETRAVTEVKMSAQQAVPQVEDVKYTYDDSGNVTSSTDTEGTSGAATETQCYGYDPLGELNQAWSATDSCAADPTTAGNATVGGPQPYWLTWTFDTTGGRTSQINHAYPASSAGSTTTTYTNGITGHVHALASSSTTGAATSSSSYAYNADGQTSSRTVGNTSQSFTYTPDGHTATIATKRGSSPTQNVNYVYDADGNVVLRRDPTSTTLYLPGEQLTRDNSSGAVTGTRYYTHNGTLVALRVGGGNPQFLFTDPRGSAEVAVPTDTNGWLTPTRRYLDPYGNPLPNSDGSLLSGPPSVGGLAWPDDHTFLNKSNDSTAGLDDLGAREYDPTTARFMSVDPVLNPADPQSVNGFAYSDNDPVNNADPSGLCPPDKCGVGVVNHGKIMAGGPVEPGNSDAGWYDVANSDPVQPGYSGAGYWQEAPRNHGGADYVTNHTPKPGIGAVDTRYTEYLNQGPSCSDMGCAFSILAQLAGDVSGVNSVIGCIKNPSWTGCGMAAVNIGIGVCAVLTDGACSVAKSGEAVAEGEAATRAADEGATLGERAAATCGGGSFSPETLVVLADGRSRPLDQLKVGDRVEATDIRTGKTTAKAVKKVWVNHDSDLMDVMVKTGGATSTVHATQHHLFWVPSRRAWVEADQLFAGEALQTDNGATAIVASTAIVPGAADMWDLTVDKDHDFYIVTTGASVLVHNCDIPDPNGRMQSHVEPRHTAGGAESAGKSVFNGGEDLNGLVVQSRGVLPVQNSGLGFRVVNAGRSVGVDQAGNATTRYTVVTYGDGSLNTMYPGVPKWWP